MQQLILNHSIRDNKQNKAVVFFIILLSIFLHQSALTSLGNLSLADPLLVVGLVFLILHRKLTIPYSMLILFLFFSAFLLLIAGLYSPFYFGIEIQLQGVLISYFKLSILFLYFLIGFNIAKYHYSNLVIKTYSYTAVIIGSFGVLGSIVYLPKISDIMFKYGSRLNGLMNDPNYFAILQVTAIAYFIQVSEIKKFHKIMFLLTLILSIILSGSKTGIVVLFVYISLKMIEKLLVFSKRTTLKALIANFGWLVTFVTISLILFIHFDNIISLVNYLFPVTQRVTMLFSDFSTAISSGGSGRDDAWTGGLNLIQLSPLFGVGIGNYLNVSNKLFNINVIAHNTFLQLGAEWGLPVTILFLGLIIFLLLKVTIKHRNKINFTVQRDIIIIFFMGSMAISLNNARFFWLVLGLLFFSSTSKQVDEKTYGIREE